MSALSRSITRTMEHYRKLGFYAEKVEQPFNPYTKRRKDLGGIGDVLLLKEGEGMILVQVWERYERGVHIKKAKASDFLPLWLLCGGRFFFNQWVQSKKGGRWKLTEEELGVQDVTVD